MNTTIPNRLRLAFALITAGALFAMISTNVPARDTDIYFTDPSASGLKPNVLLVLDTSGSMNEYVSNCMSRIDHMKKAMKTIIDESTNVNVGVMRFSRAEGASVIYPLGDLDATRLAKTRQSFAEGFGRILTGRKKVDAAVLEQIEELLITADVGVPTATALIERITAAKVADVEALQNVLRTEVLALLSQHPPTVSATAKPHVIMVVGVNGVGKTTTIGKLAARFTAQGRSVLIAAADTFRAAAADQLAIWAERAGAGIVRHKDGTDPAAVAYDAVDAALARQTDVVIVDTADRLHTKVNLMEEIKKGHPPSWWTGSGPMQNTSRQK